MNAPIQQLCSILLEKAQSKSVEDLSSLVAEVLGELELNDELAQSLKQDSRIIQINMGESKGYQVLVKDSAIADVGDQYHFDAESVVRVLGNLLDEFAKTQPIVGIPTNLRSGVKDFIGRQNKLTGVNESSRKSVSRYEKVT